jgi:hypothetical protein
MGDLMNYPFNGRIFKIYERIFGINGRIPTFYWRISSFYERINETHILVESCETKFSQKKLPIKIMSNFF